MDRAIRFKQLNSHLGRDYLGILRNKEEHIRAKKRGRRIDREMNTALYVLRAKQMGLSLDEMEMLDEGFITDMIIESNNDSYDGYQQLASQEDFDKF